MFVTATPVIVVQLIDEQTRYCDLFATAATANIGRVGWFVCGSRGFDNHDLPMQDGHSRVTARPSAKFRLQNQGQTSGRRERL